MLIVYEGWSNLRLIDAVSVVIAPIVAVFMSHVFADGLVRHVELGRRANKREWLEIVHFEYRFLLLAVPPVAILVILNVAGVALNDALHIVIWLEALSIAVWAGLAAHIAGFPGRMVALAVVAGLVVSATILALQILLEPGKAAQDGARARSYPMLPTTPMRKPIQG